MAGNRAGGKAAAETNKSKYGADFYSRIGSLGGKKGESDGVVKGFAAMDRKKHLEASIKGGRRSRRGKNV